MRSTSHDSNLCIYLQSPVVSSILGPNIVLRTLLRDILSLCCSLKVKVKVSHPHKTIGKIMFMYTLTLILRRSRTGTVWFYTSTSNKRATRPKLYTKSLTRDLKLMYRRLTLVRISIKLYAPCVLYIGTGVSLLSRERFLYI